MVSRDSSFLRLAVLFLYVNPVFTDGQLVNPVFTDGHLVNPVFTDGHFLNFYSFFIFLAFWLHTCCYSESPPNTLSQTEGYLFKEERSTG